MTLENARDERVSAARLTTFEILGPVTCDTKLKDNLSSKSRIKDIVSKILNPSAKSASEFTDASHLGTAIIRAY